MPVNRRPSVHPLLAALILALSLWGCAKAPPPPVMVGIPPPRPERTPQEQTLEQALNEFYGAPYRSGGTSPAGVDCSGLVLAAYQRTGVDLPRSAAQQFNYGLPVQKSDLRFGDVVFFNRYCQTRQPKPRSFLASIFSSPPENDICHNGIYVGNGRFVHANRNGVHVSRLDAEVWRNSYAGAKRFLHGGPPSADQPWRQPEKTLAAPPAGPPARKSRGPITNYDDWARDYDMFSDVPAKKDE